MLDKNSLLGDFQETADGLWLPSASSISLEMTMVVAMVMESGSVTTVLVISVESVLYSDVLPPLD